MLSPWTPGWSPRQALLDCDEPAYVFDESQIKQTAPYSGLETWDFPEPLGEMKVTHHAHEEPLTMPTVIGKGLKYCDFKYYLSPQPAAFVTAGLASKEPVEVNGVQVKPIDLLIKLLPKSENAFLNENPANYEEMDKTQYVCLMSEIKGTQDGAEKTYRIHMPKLTANGGKLYELFGTSLINVALPAVIAAKMAFERKTEAGLIFPEALNAGDFLKRFLDTGIPYEWHEL
jgi:saccharopine dehydrogenase-like NADP-dependent oxidoreductase